MNKLITDYDVARKALFEHCGVLDGYEQDFNIETVDSYWSIIRPGKITFKKDPTRKTGLTRTLISHDSTKSTEYRGKDITLVLIDEGDFESNLKWLVLDNTREIK